jgi:leader peptidase (prepilin peptidase) / N-methyltransferase
MDAFVALVCGLFGLLVGSFLNVVIWRVPRGESIVKPPSACPTCHTELKALDLVPVLSWVFLRGKCRTCHTKISARYPFVEALTAVLWMLVGWRFSDSWALPAYLAFTAFLVALSGIDLDTFKLPRRIIYLGGAVGVVLLTVATFLEPVDPDGRWMPLGKAALGAVLAFAFFFLIHVASPRAMGFGDVRLSAYLGWHLGWLGLLYVPVGLFLGFLLGAVVGVALMLQKKAGRKTAIPFGPYMAAGALIAVLVGSRIIDVWLPS